MYFTSEISAESLQKIYEALGVPATGRVAVNFSTGESANSDLLKPALICEFVNGIDGTPAGSGTVPGENEGDSWMNWKGRSK